MAKTAQIMQSKSENIMRKPKLVKAILNIGGTEDKLERGFKLLKVLTGKQPVKVKATKRIPTWGVRPGLEVGTKVTLRGKEAEKMIERILPAIGNTLKEKQISTNFLSFGIHEYIEIPGMEYIREVGIMGFEITAVFERSGKRVERKKVKSGKTKRQDVTPQEIIEYMTNRFKTKVLMKERGSAKIN